MKVRSVKSDAMVAPRPGAPTPPIPRALLRARVRPPARPALQLSLQFADARHRALLPRHRVARWIRAALDADAQITVRVVAAEEAQRLNRDYRRRDYATNVLTFDYARAPVVVADLVLCAPVLEAEAKAQRMDLTAHYAHLLVHGTLHAQGHDHEHAAQARRMEALEGEILARLGFDDPYAEVSRRRGGQRRGR